MIRKLRVSYYDKRPYIRILADYLNKFGFHIGDRIKLTISDEKILIEKTQDEIPETCCDKCSIKCRKQGKYTY